MALVTSEQAASNPEYQGMSDIAKLLLQECQALETDGNIATRSTAVQAEFTTQTPQPDQDSTRSRITGLLERLSKLTRNPHDFLHDFVASNWEHGALYAILQLQILDQLHASGNSSLPVDTLSTRSGVPADKLRRLLGLLRCAGIIAEPSPDSFGLNSVSRALVEDPPFRSWVEFQYGKPALTYPRKWTIDDEYRLFETRIASANLADALAKTPNQFGDGLTGFEQGFGMEMYDWHVRHPKKGSRFRRAMQGVGQAMDPADALLRDYFDEASVPRGGKVIEIGGRYGFASILLAGHRPDLTFEVRSDLLGPLQQAEKLIEPESRARVSFTHTPELLKGIVSGEAVSAFVIRNVLWNLPESEVVALLAVLIPTLRQDVSARIFITDGVSPPPGLFPPHEEIAYRRRDVTLMTMHNVKQRTVEEWEALFTSVDAAVKIRAAFQASRHIYKGAWELRL